MDAARAGVWLQPSVAWLQFRRDDGADDVGVDSTRILSSGSVGYAFVQGFFLGAQGFLARDSQTGNYTWAVGPGGGLLLKGFELTAAYLPIARDLSAAGFATGGGFAVNLGYLWRLFGPVRLGFRGTYASITLSEREGVELPNRPQVTYFAPQLSLGLDF